MISTHELFNQIRIILTDPESEVTVKRFEDTDNEQELNFYALAEDRYYYARVPREVDYPYVTMTGINSEYNLTIGDLLKWEDFEDMRFWTHGYTPQTVDNISQVIAANFHKQRIVTDNFVTPIFLRSSYSPPYQIDPSTDDSLLIGYVGFKVQASRR